MYNISRIRSYNENKETLYYYESKNDKGQPMCFYLTFKENRYYAVTFYVSSKRKRGFETLKQTGVDGLKPLIWAKSCLKDFIENVAKSGDLIVVDYDDKRRKDVYAYGLKNLGFYFGRFEKRESLILKIK